LTTGRLADANQPDRVPPVSPTSLPLPDETLSGGGEMGARIRAHDWAATPLGSADAWPQSLRTAVSICLASRFPMLIWWGPELVMLYNDAYRPILGQSKHPGALGQRGRECWPEIWDTIGPMLTGVLERGAATWSDDQLLLLDRNGYLEECYFTFSYSPIRDESGGVGGAFTAVTETTGEVLAARRLNTLREMAAATAEARTAEAVCDLGAQALATNPDDLPFALVYLLEADGAHATLHGASGMAPGSAAAPSTVALDGSKAPGGDPWSLAQVRKSGQPHLTQHLRERFGADGAFTAALPLDAALVLPVARPGQERAEAFLVAGISPRRALDDAYRSFFGLVTGQIATAIANARAHQEERARIAALAELDRAKTDFFSNISHEFRTPLTLLLAPVEDALADANTARRPRKRQRLELIHRNALRLIKLVNTLLDFSRIEAGRADAVYALVDLPALTADLASAFRSAIERAGLRFVVECPPLPDDFAPVYVDREMWEKIVLNLLSNAFKFTFEGEIAISLVPTPNPSPVRRRGKLEAPGWLELRVCDTGVGIPLDELPHLFERFHRVRGTRARTHEGSGIGLALVQQLVLLHGGIITAESAPGQGTTFTVTLPTGTAHLPADRVGAMPRQDSTALGAAPYVAEALRWSAGVGPSGARDARGADDAAAIAPAAARAARRSIGAAQERPARILLADDNADMREYLARLLGDHWVVEAVADGASALAVARERPPDLALCDVMMPEMDGMELLRALRADPRTRDVPVMLLSARAGEEAVAEGLRAGADDYLVKPFAARELLLRIATHLDLARMRQETAHREHERAEQLHKLASASLDITATLALEERVQRTARHARAVVDARLAVIVLDGDLGSEPLIAADTIDTIGAAGPAVPLAVRDLPQLVATTEPLTQPLRLTAEQVANDARLAPFAAALVAMPGGATGGWLSVPLRERDGRRIGLALVLDKARDGASDDFGPADEAVLAQLGQMAAFSLENAALFREIQDANALRDAALFMVTHDLKQPLTAIKANVQMVQRQFQRDEPVERKRARERLATIDETSDKMTAQINELLDAAKLQAGQPLELDWQPVEFVALVQRLVAEQRPSAPRHTITVESNVDALPGEADAPRLARVLGNLLSNAVKYSPAGGTITVRLRRDEQPDGVPCAVIAVTDQGMGIPPTELPHIFEAFRRASNVTHTTIPGTGIGLASARHVMEQHGGSVTVESRLGAGTTFTVRLPLAPPEVG
jgi:signal transduction histidine kinase/DNA-binding response OmpR family regulator